MGAAWTGVVSRWPAATSAAEGGWRRWEPDSCVQPLAGAWLVGDSGTGVRERLCICYAILCKLWCGTWVRVVSFCLAYTVLQRVVRTQPPALRGNGPRGGKGALKGSGSLCSRVVRILGNVCDE